MNKWAANVQNFEVISHLETVLKLAISGKFLCDLQCLNSYGVSFQIMATVHRMLTCPLVRQNICGQCQLLRGTVPALWMAIRGSKNWKRKVLRREDLKDNVVEYVGQNPRRADRVYAWGCATTGALGKCRKC